MSQINDEYELVIIDNGSCYKPMVEFLNNCGLKIYKMKRIRDMESLSANIREAIKSHSELYAFDYYVVTDSDITLDNVNGDILSFYKYVLDTNEDITVAGGMIRIDDIPDNYPCKNTVLRTHGKYYWSKPTHTIEYKGNSYKYVKTKIDTTFGMYRGDFEFRNWQDGFRMLPPYSIRHSDFYLDGNSMTEEQKYYLGTSSDSISHWGGRILKNKIKELEREKLRSMN